MALPTIDRDFTRLEFYSDAVFAFMATLLVVSLEVPTDFHEFIDRIAGFPGFAIGFLVLTLLWARHRAFFKAYGHYDAAVLLANAAVLFSILFFVFPLKWMVNVVLARWLGLDLGSAGRLSFASYDEVRTLFLLFTCGFTAVFASFTLLHAAAWRRRDALELDAAARSELRFRLRTNALATAFGLLATGLAAARIGLAIGAPGWVLFLLVPLRAALRRASRG